MIDKVRSGQPLTADDLVDRQGILVTAGVGDDASFALASDWGADLGSFDRLLVGLAPRGPEDSFAADEIDWRLETLERFGPADGVNADGRASGAGVTAPGIRDPGGMADGR